MSQPTLTITDLQASVEDKQILKGINLTVKGGEIHAIMGPNGNGKSTLAAALMGNPKYAVTKGTANLDGESLLDLEVDERSKAGLFLAMQYPSEIGGVTNSDFLRSAVNAHRGEGNEIGLFPFVKKLNQSVKKLEMRDDLPHRYLNEGFSGGEKKRNEILQMLMLEPKIAILDEIDSGLDIDALRIVGTNITEMVKERNQEMGVILITHYQRLLDYIEPDFVHVLIDGKIVKTGDASLARRLETEGYEWLKAELGLQTLTIEEEATTAMSRPANIGSCGTRQKLGL
ncbi:MAG: Fe-S cluster assembly ATPase SufC [Culicoidibacterales bacterium]